MNKNLHRIIFNAKRGLRMAVAETASAQGKGGSGESGGGSAGGLISTLHPLCFALSAALGMVLLNLTPAQAQIKADPNAPASQRPTVLQTANGLPQVNIQTPSAAGVSRNTYSQFDVQHNGTILNNSRIDTSTQLGGWVQANPWLATGAARVILNEVNSSNPSQLNGYVEVAGQRAEVIIANPAGITVNGGGFLNASSVTLTTGTPVINTGSLESYRVQRGSVSIDGAGLDTSTADYTNILARAVQVNAGIWAKDLKVVTGTNEIAANNAAAPTVTGVASASGAAPSFALDVAALGGMYAGKIFLVGTEAGLGMRNSGAIGASAGDVVLQNNGWLTNSGTVYANGNTSVTSQSGISNQANGLIAALGNTTITANSLSSSANSVLGAGIKTDGTLTASGNLGITTIQSLSANGQTLAAGDVTLSGGSVDLSGSQTSAANIGITATAGNVSTVNATVVTRGTTGILGITAKANNNQSLNNTQGVLSAGQLNLDVANLNNTQGQVIQIGSGDTTIALTSPTGTLNNTGGTIASNGNTTLSAQTLTNNQGQVTALGTLGIHLNTATGGGALSNTQGLIAANGDVSVTASSFDNTLGTLASVQSNLSLVTTGVTINDSGKIQAALDVTLTNAGLSNTRTGSISGRHLSINTGGQALNNAGGTLAASQSANLQTGALNNDGGLIQTGADLTLNTHAQTLTNTRAANYTSSNTQLNGKGGIAAQGTATLTTGDLNNDAGYLGSQGALLATSANISNTQGGQIQGLDNITLTAVGGRINNSAGLIRSALATSLSAANIDNSNTSGTDQGIEGNRVAISANTLTNNDGAIRADSNITVTSSGTVNNTAGTLIAGQNTRITAASLGGDGKVLSQGDIAIDLTGDFNNSAEVTANHNASISTSGRITNSGKLQAGNALNISSANLDNTATGEISASTTQVSVTAALTNRGLMDGQDTQLNADTLNNIGTGRIYGDTLSIAATTLNNDSETVAGSTRSATIAARSALDIGVQTLNNRGGSLIYSAGDMAIGGLLDASRHAADSANTVLNGSSTIEARGQLGINATTLTNANDNLTIETQLVNTQTSLRDDLPSYYRIYDRYTYEPVITQSTPGQIISGGDMQLNATQITNQQSSIMAGGTLGVVGTSVNNVAIPGQRRINDVGTQWSWGVIGGHSDCWPCHWVLDYGMVASSYNVNAYNDLTVIEGVALQNTTAVGSGTTVAGRSTGSVGVNTRGATAASVSIASVNVAGSTLRTLTAPSTALPSLSLYRINTNPNAVYLVETDPRFTNRQQWLGSDYMLQTLSLDPSITQKRLGDGYYEQTLIREQVAQLTGRRFLGDYSTDEQQYQALMDAGITYAKAHNLRPGIALSAAQMAQLTSDIVWLVEKEVTLADGSKTKALVPQVYAMVQPGDLQPSGALLAGKNVNLNLSGDLTNSGSIAGKNVVNLSADNIQNLGGRIQGDAVALSARTDLNNIGGQISATSLLSARAGRDLNVLSTTSTSAEGSRSATTLNRLAGLSVNSATGTLLASAGRDVNLIGATVNSQGSAQVQAARNLNLGTVSTGETLHFESNGEATYRQHLESSLETGSSLNAAKNLTLQAGQDLNARAANVQAAGALEVYANRNITLEAGQSSQSSDLGWTATNNGLFSSSSTTTRNTSASTRAIASNFGGNSVTAIAGNDLKVTGSNIVSDTAATLLAKNNITIEAAKTTHSQTSDQQTSESGFLSSNALADHNTSHLVDNVASNLQANTILISAGQDLTIKGSNINATQDAVLLAKRDVNITAAQNSYDQSQAHQESSSGFTNSLLAGQHYSTTQASQNATVQGTTSVGSSVSGTNVVITGGRDATVQASQVLADQNIDITAGRNVQLHQATDTQTASNASQSSSTSLQLQVGLAPKQTAFSKNGADGNGTGTSTNAVTSVLSANNGNLTITAGTDNQYKGVGQGNLSTQGADLLAKGDVSLNANRVDLGAAQGDSQSMSHSSTSSFSVGAALAGTVGSLITQIYDQTQAAKDGTGNARLDAALALKSGYDSYKLIDGGAKTAIATADAGQAMGNGSAFGIAASINSSHSESKSADSTSTQRGTNIQAGNLNITARETDINAQGAKLQAENISLDAARNLNLQAASNSANTQSSNSNSSAGVGVTVGLGQQNGISFQLGGSTGHGNANGSETTYDNTLVTASKQLSIKSGKDTNLQGAQLAGKQVTTDIGGNLNIETLQDSSSYTSKQESAGFGVNLCLPPICVGSMVAVSVNAAQQKIDHNYQSAVGQSGINAGTDGFDIKVKGNTDLKGGAITSSADKSKNSLQTASLTYSDLENKQDTSASSTSLSVGNSTSALAQAGVNLMANLAGQTGLSENGSQRSSTQSVISPATVTITGTGEATKDAQSQTNANTLTSRDASKANQSLKNTLTLQDAAKVQADLKTAQQNQQAAQLVGSVMDNMIGDLAATKQWKEGSTEKVLLHGLSGAIQASIAGGSLVAGTAAGAANEKLIPVMTDYLEKNGVPQYIKDEKGNTIQNPQFADLMKIGSTLVGAGVGAAAGGGASNVALGASVGLTGTTYNRLLHDDEKAKIAAMAPNDPQEQAKLTAAACAMVHCSAEFAPGTPESDKYKEMERQGATYTNELEQLNRVKQQTGQFSYSTSGFLNDESKDNFKFGLNVANNVVIKPAVTATTNALIGTGKAVLALGNTDVVGAYGPTNTSTDFPVGTPGVTSSYVNERDASTPSNATQQAAYDATNVALVGVAVISTGKTVVGSLRAGESVVPAVTGVVDTVGANGGTAVAGEIATPVTSGGTANVVTVPGLKGQLAAENLANIAAQDARLAKAATGSGTAKPDFAVGSGTATEANSLGQIWVGDGARPLSGVPGGLISADGTRVYRPPSAKKAPVEFNPTGVQANFQMRDPNTGAVTSNGHMVIK